MHIYSSPFGSYGTRTVGIIRCMENLDSHLVLPIPATLLSTHAMLVFAETTNEIDASFS